VRPRIDIKTRFFKHVKITDGCWEWFGNKAKGYGHIRQFKGCWKSVKAHRVSYELFVGKIPKGMLVCHKCDNPACVNPEHLFVGTAKDNSLDCVKKDRCVRLRGEFSPMHKLTQDQVMEIRERYKDGYSQTELGREYGLHHGSIWAIVHNVSWKYLL
jgi:hypothetical protein